MKRLIISLMLMCPMVAFADVPAITQLFESYATNENVTIAEVDKALIQMAMAQSDDTDTEAIEELDTISILECSETNTRLEIISAIDAIVSSEELSTMLNVSDEECNVSIYSKQSGEEYSDIIIIVKDDSQLVVVNIKGAISPATVSELISVSGQSIM